MPLLLHYQDRIEDFADERFVGTFQIGGAIEHGKLFFLLDNESGRSAAIQVDGLLCAKILHNAGQVHNRSTIGKPRQASVNHQNDGGAVFADAYAGTRMTGKGKGFTG